MHLLNILVASIAILPSVLGQFAGYYNISSAMPTLRYLAYDNRTRKVESQTRNPLLQQWFITNDPSGYSLIANRQGGAVLTAVNGNSPGNLDLEQAQGLNFLPNSISSQAWKITRLADGYYEFESMRYPGSVLDIRDSSTVDGAQVLVHPRNSAQTPNQKWRISKPSIDILANYGW